MKSAQQYISKGFYKYSQISDFISVKNYMFIRQKNKKCLLLRFSNDMEYPVEAMEFTVVQLDSAGKILARTKISLEKLNFVPGGTYTTQKSIVVDEYCSDFKILFAEARSGRYKYKVKDGNVIVHYLKLKPQITEGGSSQKSVEGFTVKPRRFGKPKLAVLMAVVVLLAVIALNLYNMFADRANPVYFENDRYESVASSVEPNVCGAETKPFRLR